MAEPPHKRARRPDSKQMWDKSDSPLPTRERDEPRDRDRDRRDDYDRRDDQDRDRNRRYRSRSPRNSRGGRERDRDRGGRDREREDREYRDGRGIGRGRDDRDYGRGGRRDEGRGGRRDDRDRDVDGDGGRDMRDKPREKPKSRDGARDSRRDSRSSSPRREREKDTKNGRGAEKDIPKSKLDDEFTKDRTATPPVSFKVGGGQDHDRTDIGGAKGKKDKVEEEVDDDGDEIIVEDDGLAAMQAMMGFGGFGTTHQKKVPGNDVSAVRKEKRTEYRQYMNRVGGFNRPLSPSRD